MEEVDPLVDLAFRRDVVMAWAVTDVGVMKLPQISSRHPSSTTSLHLQLYYFLITPNQFYYGRYSAKIHSERPSFPRQFDAWELPKWM